MDDTRFISEPIEVEFNQPPFLEKRPGCPNRFIWNGETFHIVEKLTEWHDYRRRGRMGMNMRPEHLARAAQRGSWGVGRDFYHVRVSTGRMFEIYYSRAPKSSDDGKGFWVLNKELLSMS